MALIAILPVGENTVGAQPYARSHNSWLVHLQILAEHPHRPYGPVAHHSHCVVHCLQQVSRCVQAPDIGCLLLVDGALGTNQVLILPAAAVAASEGRNTSRSADAATAWLLVAPASDNIFSARGGVTRWRLQLAPTELEVYIAFPVAGPISRQLES